MCERMRTSAPCRRLDCVWRVIRAGHIVTVLSRWPFTLDAKYEARSCALRQDYAQQMHNKTTFPFRHRTEFNVRTAMVRERCNAGDSGAKCCCDLLVRPAASQRPVGGCYRADPEHCVAVALETHTRFTSALVYVNPSERSAVVRDTRSKGIRFVYNEPCPQPLQTISIARGWNCASQTRRDTWTTQFAAGRAYDALHSAPGS
jgi:hypothetical protein